MYKLSEYGSLTYVCVLLVSYTAYKCSVCLLAGLCWRRLEEADSINGPSPPYLTEQRESHLDLNSHSRQSTLRTSPLLIQRRVAMETSVKTQDLVVLMWCV